MGSNMQRQAVPLLITESPLVATGMEGRVTKDSGATVIAKKEGKVISVTADRIIIWNEDKEIDVYRLKKFLRSNQDTCINQFPIIEKGERIRKGQVIADGPAISKGKIALGKNVLVAFMPWEGYNFEDAILISERLVKQDVFSSVHIQEFETEARDIKIGSEEITRDIPNVSEEALANLDERGIIREGAEVNPGDILVGKVTPRGEIQTTPEERLLKVIFGKKAEDVQDASLCVPPGVSGKVLEVKVFTRKEKRGKREENKIIKKLEEYYKKEIAELRIQRDKKVAHLEANVKKRIIRQNEAKPEIEKIKIFTEAQIAELKNDKKRKTDNVKMGDDLAISVNMLVKVFLVTKRKIMVGDKVAGRHGNKGVIAKILPEEDMPYLLDGTSVDVVLSPLSVPSRMNVGQILELMLGWAGKILDTEMVTPIFDGAREEDIIEQIKRAKQKLREAGVAEKYLPTDDCRITLYDGRTGEPFFEKVAIGYMYILKLAHLVEDKIHARSTGPYSLITRQPLGGKAQFGGQRFGEMEVWAVEGYGGAYILQEFLTVKSDDVPGRTKMYESIIKGEAAQPPGIPESFRVLVRELQSLGLNVELLKEKGTKQK
jgi:DNA-directed RNA polymerase subunit beta